MGVGNVERESLDSLNFIVLITALALDLGHHADITYLWTQNPRSFRVLQEGTLQEFPSYECRARCCTPWDLVRRNVSTPVR